MFFYHIETETTLHTKRRFLWNATEYAVHFKSKHGVSTPLKLVLVKIETKLFTFWNC
jgi:hypothetical protein